MITEYITKQRQIELDKHNLFQNKINNWNLNMDNDLLELFKKYNDQYDLIMNEFTGKISYKFC